MMKVLSKVIATRRSGSNVTARLAPVQSREVRIGDATPTRILAMLLVLLGGCQPPLLDSIVRQQTGLPFEKLDGPRGDVVLSIVSDSGGVIFAGMRGKGVYRSVDAGRSWEPTSLTEGDVFPLYITATGKLFAFIRKSFFDRTVAVSIDHGNTWDVLPESYDRNIGTTVLRQFDGVLYSEGMQKYRVGGAGLHRSTDDGVTWETLQDSTLSTRCSGEYPLEIVSDSSMFAMCSDGVFHSRDQGRTWRKLPLPFGSFSVFRRDLTGGVIAEVSGALMDGCPKILIRIHPSGDSWEDISAERRFREGSPSIETKNGVMLIGENSTSTGIWRSTDRGRTWLISSVNSGAVNSFCVTPSGAVYAAMNGAIFKSDDEGLTWTECCQGLAQRGISHLFMDAAGSIWAGTELGGLYRSTDEGSGWTRATPGLLSIRRGFSLAPGHVLIGTGSASPNDVYTLDGSVHHRDFTSIALGVEVSHDTGSTWTSSERRSLDNWAIVPGQDTDVFTSGREHNLSTDGGDTWTTESMFSQARAIHSTPAGLFVVREDTLWYRENDAGDWRSILSERFLNGVTTTKSTILCMTPWKLLRSTDLGDSWDAWRIQQDDPRLRWFVPVTDSIVAVVGERPVIHLSRDAGESWQEIRLEIGLHSRITGAILDSRNRLLLGTSEGLFRTTTPIEWPSLTQ